MKSLESLLPRAVDIAHAAGRDILQIYAQEFTVDQKGDQSPLTAADLASHVRIMEGLAALAPDVPRMSEEGSEIPFSERRQWQTYWLVDPLDGTREFVKRNGEFTVNIALIRDGKPVLGVVHSPVLGKTYFAAEGHGAWREETGQPAVAITTSRTLQPPRILASRSHSTPEMEALLARLPEHRALNIGSSLKFCLVAEGEADFYPRLGPTSEWDTAAGHCVVEQAGGIVTDLAMQPLRYNTKESLLNPFFLVIGEPGYAWARYLPEK
jgi:3'(2'), 5'-bisphosphate nucleotidase